MKFLKAEKIFGQTSLQTQGLALLFFLFVFQTIFFATFYFQIVEKAEEESRRQEQFKIILKKTEGLAPPFAKALKEMTEYVQYKDPERLKNYHELADEVVGNLDWLKTHLSNDAKSAALLKQIDVKLRIGQQTMDFACKTCGQIKDPQQALKRFNDIRQDYQKDWMEMILPMQDLMQREDWIVSQHSPEEQRRYRRLMRTVLVVGYGIEFLFLVALFRFLIQMITSRLTVMVDDTEKFRVGKDLNALLPGRDEIAQLNRSFHTMADEVREAQRMRQTFVAMISHDLRTPLTSVQGYLELVSIGAMGEVSEKIKRGAGMAEQNVGRLIRLISDLLDLEKMEAGQMKMAPKVIYMESVIEKSVLAINEFAKSHDVKLEYSESDAEVFADPDRLIQVIINLASNAIKFSPKGETVEIKTTESSDSVEVQVIDHGRGVPQEYREIIFEKYRQVKTEDGSKKGGTGLGLPICKLIIEQLGGSIGVNSEEGKGSTFWFKLPKVSAGKEGGQPAVQ